MCARIYAYKQQNERRILNSNYRFSIQGIMEYNYIIKEAREKLGIYKRDLAGENLSKNLLSNIEAGKTNLTPQKALMLYRRFLEISLKKEIFIEVDFDELLYNNDEYNRLKEANSICKMLKDVLDSKRDY